MSSITSVPIKQRPKPDWRAQLRFISFNVFFAFCLICFHLLQCFVALLHFIPPARPLKTRSITWSKGAFGLLLVWISQLFAPTTIHLTVDQGVQISSLTKRDAQGHLVLDLPRRNVIISNHQIYNDWLYIWSLLCFANLQDSVYIILKASLKWVPVVGPSMQLMRFIFLNRSWEADRRVLHRKLLKLGAHAQASDDNMSLLIFPEGTLVSRDTRPISKKFADKSKIDDMRNTLLPRSTGLLFCLRALAHKVPDLQIIDLTIGYPGINPHGYGQDYYTLQSVFGHNQPPPSIQIHVSLIPLSSIPLGSLPNDSSDAAEPTEEEKKAFSDWVLERWRIKDQLLDRFYESGSFTGESDGARDSLDLPLQLRSTREMIKLGSALALGGLISLEAIRSLFVRAITGGR